MGVFALLRDRFPCMKMERDVSLARRTTIGCGGRASCVVSPSDAEEAAELISFLKKERIPHAFLGAGANTLPPDGDYDAAIVSSDALRGIVYDGNALFAGAGVTGGSLVRYAMENSLGGVEPFVGIPMTVGGGCVMNAGVKEKHFSDLVLRVLAVRNGRIESFPVPACRFGEKRSIFQENLFVVGVLLRVERVSVGQLRKNCREYLARRRTLPKGRSMGCTFVNPEGVSAGELIDRAGLKGLAFGGARVSSIHANFIINEGGTSSDVSALIDIIKNEVLLKTGILLREEIRRLELQHT